MRREARVAPRATYPTVCPAVWSAPQPLGSDGRYRCKPVVVLAKQIAETFSIARSAGGDVLHGKANDWLLQYAPGDYGVVENSRFLKVYRLIGL